MIRLLILLLLIGLATLPPAAAQEVRLLCYGVAFIRFCKTGLGL
jgi:hypothetical protein